MADGIQIPSPSAFLRHTPPPHRPIPNPPSAANNNSHNSSSRPPARRPTAVDGVGKQKTSAVQRKAGAAPAGIDKIKQSKSRNGCLTCKAKRLKCDEEKPGCLQCRKRNVVCGGYKKDFKWRPFEETNVKLQIDRQNQLQSHRRAKSRSAETSKPTTPITEHPPALKSHVDGSDAQRKKDSFVADVDGSILPNLSQSSFPNRLSHSPHRRTSTTSPAEELPPQMLPPPASPLPLSTPRNLAAFNHRKRSRVNDERPGAASIPRLSPRSRSPTISELLAPLNPHPPNVLDSGDMDLTPTFSSPEDTLLDPDLLHGHLVSDEIHHLIHGLHPHESLPTSPIPQHLNMSDNLGLQDLSLRPTNFRRFEQEPPNPTDVGIDALIWRFLNVTASVRSVVDGPNENPWRTLVMPLAQGSPALTHALAAMAAFHLMFDYEQMRLVGQQHKHASLRYLQEGLREGNMSEEAAIATALALGISESWEVSTASGNTHIKGAQILVRNALQNHRLHPLKGEALLLLKFLCNAWVYLDVIARLTAVDSDESNEFDSTFLFLPGSPNMVADGDNGFGINFGMPVDARLDPLMGCANTLFPLIGRVANLVRKVCRSLSNSPSIISQARDLKRLLEDWDPPAVVDEPEDPSTEIEHCVQTAEAYRWATLLHLHQSVPELPSLSSAELAQRVLQYLATVPPESRTVIVQTYPLMVAGCEAAASPPNNNRHHNDDLNGAAGRIDDADSDRHWVRGRWARVQARMHIGVLDRCAVVVEEVWRRRDAYEKLPSTRRKLVATADLQPVRRNTQPLVRTDTGSWGGDPGRTGVVFSYVDVGMGGDFDGMGAKLCGPQAGNTSSQQNCASGPNGLMPSGNAGSPNNNNRGASVGPASASHVNAGPPNGPGPGRPISAAPPSSTNPVSGPGEKSRDGARRPTTRHDRNMDPAYTVRGHLHWVGVMWDWGWEVLLG